MATTTATATKAPAIPPLTAAEREAEIHTRLFWTTFCAREGVDGGTWTCGLDRIADDPTFWAARSMWTLVDSIQNR